eukprot:TRINITY_DN4897_c0_g1_i1.p1 TRINITY_DN4897_c0_g1~~TRINITY_DN4897_c0_g1_i1.p1  ORF type:complete len:139 (+),score=33.97 TRINITY_DN4897_c0_g1_i1:58-474(+)
MPAMLPKKVRESLLVDRSNYWESFFDKWGSVKDQNDEGMSLSEFDSPDKSICHTCGTKTEVPKVFDWKFFQCNACLIESSGHQKCVTPNCGLCIKIGAILSKRQALIEASKEGRLSKEYPQGFYISKKSSSGGRRRNS